MTEIHVVFLVWFYAVVLSCCVPAIEKQAISAWKQSIADDNMRAVGELPWD